MGEHASLRSQINPFPALDAVYEWACHKPDFGGDINAPERGPRGAERRWGHGSFRSVSVSNQSFDVRSTILRGYKSKRVMSMALTVRDVEGLDKN